MLVLGVAVGDYIMIDDKIKIRVIKTGDLFRLAIDAPKEMAVYRKSVYEANNPAYQDSGYEKKKKRKKTAVK